MKTRKLSVLLLCAALVISPLTACGEQKSAGKPLALSIVAGNHANTRLPNLNGPAVKNLVNQVVVNGGTIDFVGVDGDPEDASEYGIKPPSTGGLSTTKQQQIIAEETSQLLAYASSLKAKTPEVDTMAALQTACRSLAAAAPDNRHILVLDSGLCTTGTMDFTKSDFLNADPKAVADSLAAKDEIPDFSGVAVTWIGCGDTALPQRALTRPQQDRLKALWKAVIEKGKGTADMKDDLPGSAASPAGYPKVSGVSLLSEAADGFDGKGIVAFSEKQIRFIADTARYADPEAAKQALAPVSAYMKQNPSFSALLVGTTAGDGDEAYCLKLSTERAEAVRGTLAGSGVSAARVRTLGMGYKGPWHIPDTDGGKLIEPLASQNRKVLVMSASSDEASRLLAGST